jgi:hypothetical protein
MTGADLKPWKRSQVQPVKMTNMIVLFFLSGLLHSAVVV